MKKRIISLSVAAALTSFAGVASAQDSADYFAFNPEGVGHIAIVPYFSTQDSNVTLVNITNTDQVNGKALKIRFRGASNSDDIFDFQVFLSPGDMWTAEVSKDSAGLSQLRTFDTSCTLPVLGNGVYQKFITTRLSPLATDKNAETREGYIEILNMGDIYNDGSSGTGESNSHKLFVATKHVNGVPPCTSSVLTGLTNENASSRLTEPTTGLMANWTLINVQRVLAYSGAAAAIEGRDIGTEDSGYGNIVFWDQRSTPLSQSEADNNTADPLFRGATPSVAGARYDLPDLSTPYLPGAPAADVPARAPFIQAFLLSNSMATTSAAAEFFSESVVGAATDWVVSFPTRRYFAAVKYGATVGTTSIVRNAETNGNVYFTPASTELGGVSNAGKSYQMCSKLGTNATGFIDREERATITDDIVISPGTPTVFSLCGEVTVVGINAGALANTATFGDVARTNVSNGFAAGWGFFKTPVTGGPTTVDLGANMGFYNGTYNDTNFGLPFLGQQFLRVSNTISNQFYGLNYPMRVTGKGEFRLYPVL